MLDEMKDEWKEIKFDLKDYPDPPKNISYVVRTYDEINAILDEHIQNTQMMTFSPFKAVFEEEILDWNASLLNMSNVLEEWAKVQGNWMYL